MKKEDKAKLLDRVRKLIALSTSPNENEAALAAEKAQALLAEHKLSMDEVLKEDSTPVELYHDHTERTDSRPWRRVIGMWCAKMYFTQYYFSFKKELSATRGNGYIRYDVHNFVGQEQDVLVAKMLFLYLSATVEQLATKNALRQPVKKRASYRTSFLHGCAQRLSARIHERIEAAKRGEIKTEAGKNLPALLDLYQTAEERNNAYLKKQMGRALATHRRRGKLNNIDGALDGREAADRISLDKQLTHG